MKNFFYSHAGFFREVWKFLLTIALILAFIILISLPGSFLKTPYRFYHPLHTGIFFGTLASLIFVFKANLSKLGVSFKKIDLFFIIAGIFTTFLFYPTYYILDWLLFNNDTLPFKKISLSIESFTMVIFYISVGAGEELFFRVYLIGHMKGKVNVIIMLLISSIIFALAHRLGMPDYSIPHFIFFTLTGLYFGLLYIISKSFYLVFIAHWLFNPFIAPNLRSPLPTFFTIVFFICVLLVIALKRHSFSDTKKLIITS